MYQPQPLSEEWNSACGCEGKPAGYIESGNPPLGPHVVRILHEADCSVGALGVERLPPRVGRKNIEPTPRPDLSRRVKCVVAGAAAVATYNAAGKEGVRTVCLN